MLLCLSVCSGGWLPSAAAAASTTTTAAAAAAASLFIEEAAGAAIRAAATQQLIRCVRLHLTLSPSGVSASLLLLFAPLLVAVC